MARCFRESHPLSAISSNMSRLVTLVMKDCLVVFSRPELSC